jgi:prevent-host-death family protein
MTMRTVGLAEAKAQLSALLDAVQAGDEVVITRRGHAVARLIANRPQAPSVGATSPWPERFRQLHTPESIRRRTAVELVREIRDEP